MKHVLLILTLFKFQLAGFEEYLDVFNATLDDGTSPPPSTYSTSTQTENIPIHLAKKK